MEEAHVFLVKSRGINKHRELRIIKLPTWYPSKFV